MGSEFGSDVSPGRDTSASREAPSEGGDGLGGLGARRVTVVIDCGRRCHPWGLFFPLFCTRTLWRRSSPHRACHRVPGTPDLFFLAEALAHSGTLGGTRTHTRAHVRARARTLRHAASGPRLRRAWPWARGFWEPRPRPPVARLSASTAENPEVLDGAPAYLVAEMCMETDLVGN